MKFGRISGQVIATAKTGKTQGLTILVVQPLDEALEPSGRQIACVDTVKAMAGDTVLLCSSSSARLTRLTRGVCVDTAIIGIIDSISTKGREVLRP